MVAQSFIVIIIIVEFLFRYKSPNHLHLLITALIFYYLNKIPDRKNS